MTGMILQTIEKSFSDNGFRVQTAEAQTCQTVGRGVLSWAIMQDNIDSFTSFSYEIFKNINASIEMSQLSSSGREKIWALLKCKYSTEIYSPSTISEPSKEISVDEANALYYVRGYLIRNLIKKFKKDANKVIALSHFLEDTEAGDAEVFSQQEWTDLFDRGGLFHCNIDFYHFLYSVEVIMKTAIKDEEGSLKDGFVGRAKNSVTTNDEVQFWWDCLCIINNLDDDLATTLFDNIISLYITVGGFCFASKWMERYKQTTTLSIINTLFSF